MTTNYKYIRAWGRMLGSYGYYIGEQIALAKKDNAPEDAIYRGNDGEWITFSLLKEETKKRVEGYLSK